MSRAGDIEERDVADELRDLRRRVLVSRAELDLTRGEDWRESFAALKAEATQLGIDLPNPYAPSADELRAALAERPELDAALRPALARRADELAAIRWNAARAHRVRLPRRSPAARRVARRRIARRAAGARALSRLSDDPDEPGPLARLLSVLARLLGGAR